MWCISILYYFNSIWWIFIVKNKWFLSCWKELLYNNLFFLIEVSRKIFFSIISVFTKLRLFGYISDKNIYKFLFSFICKRERIDNVVKEKKNKYLLWNIGIVDYIGLYWCCLLKFSFKILILLKDLI
jgi:hypothetical protein